MLKLHIISSKYDIQQLRDEGREVMTVSYRDYYNVIDTYKDNSQQKILIGATDDDKKQPVIINIIKNPELFDGIEEESLGNVFLNLLYFQQTADEVILVGALKDALPLDTYVCHKNPSIKERMDLLYAYLQSITRYVGLRDDIISMLVDEGQIVVENDTLILDELIILPEEEAQQHFSYVDKIIRVIDKLFDMSAVNHMDNLYLEQVSLLKEELLSAERPIENLHELFKIYRKRYIYAYCLESFEEPIHEAPKGRWAKKERSESLLSNYEEGKAKLKSKISISYKALMYVGLALILLVGGYSVYRLMSTDTRAIADAYQEKLPLPYFEAKQKDKEWEFINKSEYQDYSTEDISISWQVYKAGELLNTFYSDDLKLIIEESGTYLVSLTLSDLKGNWNKEYSEEIIVLEESEVEENITSEIIIERNGLLEQVNQLQGSLKEDLENKRNGLATYKIADEPTTIQLASINVSNNTVLSMWIMMEAQEKLQIRITGYKDKLIQFQETMSHTPINTGYWEMLQLNIKETKANSIDISFSGFTKPISIDDLQLSVIK